MPALEDIIGEALQLPNSYQQSATATERSAWGRLQEVVSVTDFGALPTTSTSGVIDVTDAFMDAIDYVADTVKDLADRKVGGAIYVPVGDWRITNIRLRNRVGIIGASRTGTVLSHIDGVGHTGPMIDLPNSGYNHTDLRNFTMQGGGDTGVNGITLINISDVNSETIYDIGDPQHRISDLDIIGFSDGTGMTIQGRSTQVRNIHISHCKNGLIVNSSDNKFTDIDINWIEQIGLKVDGGTNEFQQIKVWFIGTDAAYETGDGLVIDASNNTFRGVVQDCSRHGVLINNGDENNIELILDNIGNFKSASNQGFTHPSSTIVSAIAFTGTSEYNRVATVLGQRSAEVDLHALVNFNSASNKNFVSIMRNPDWLIAGGEDAHFDRATGSDNVVEINGRRPNIVVSDIAETADDGFETISTTVVSISAGDAGMALERLHAFRFLVPDLPQGVTITDCRIQFHCASSNSGAMAITFWCEDADAAAALQAVNADISGRAQTTASVSWASVPAWVSGGRNGDTLTPDLSSIAQEVVDRAGFDGVLLFLAQGDTAIASAFRSVGFHGGVGVATLKVVYET